MPYHLRNSMDNTFRETIVGGGWPYCYLGAGAAGRPTGPYMDSGYGRGAQPRLLSSGALHEQNVRESPRTRPRATAPGVETERFPGRGNYSISRYRWPPPPQLGRVRKLVLRNATGVKRVIFDSAPLRRTGRYVSFLFVVFLPELCTLPAGTATRNGSRMNEVRTNCTVPVLCCSDSCN